MSGNMERDRSNLDMATELKDQANKRYQDKDYGAAMMLYHKCLLHARAVAQLSNINLQMMARDERDADDEEGEEGVGAAKKNAVQKKDSTSSANGNGSAFDAPSAAASASSTAGGDDDDDDRGASSTTAATKERRSRIDSTTRGEEMKEESRALIAKCYNNLAACIVNGPTRKSEDYMRAVFYCDKVLEIEENNEKAIFRKACALKKAEKYDKAIELFEKYPNNAQAKVLIQECKLKLVEERKKRDDAIRANFAKARQAEQRNGVANGDAAAGAPPAMNGNAVNGNVRQ